MRYVWICLVFLATWFCLSVCPATQAGENSIEAQIVVGAEAPELEQYAARELQRYLYALSGTLLPITTDAKANSDAAFVVGQPGTNKKISEYVQAGLLKVSPEDPGEQGYVLKSFKNKKQQVLAIAGSDAIGSLYGVYGLLEDHYGVGFYFDGDVMPETKMPLVMAAVDERKRPKQAVRGVLPWINFFQSATVWSMADFRFTIDQMAKMRMNLLNLHNYNGFWGHQEMFFPFNPAVRYWMATTRSGHNWACPGWAVHEYRFGAGSLFDDYDFGSEVTLHNDSLTNMEIIRKATAFYQQVIAYAHRRGVRVALGLEGGDPKFIVENYPDIDYVLMYATEMSNERPLFNKPVYETLKKETKIRMGVSGWGIKGSLADFPSDLIAAPISPYTDGCADGSQFGQREYWGCPWMERDGARVCLKEYASSQHWYPYSINLSSSIVAYRNASTNMTGWQTLTWRTADAIAPKLAWMAKAPWGFPIGSPWGFVGGKAGKIDGAVSGSDTAVVKSLQSYRQGASFGYRFDVTAGTDFLHKYRVRLYCAEPQNLAAGARCFDVLVNGKPVLRQVDLVARAGSPRKLVTLEIPDLQCPFGILSVDFKAVAGEALVNAVIVDRAGDDWIVKLNCGGEAVEGMEADVAYGANSYRAYRDYAVRCYGEAAADEIADIINQNEPLAVGGGEAEPCTPLWANPDPTGNVVKAEAQIATIDRLMAQTKDRGRRERLRLLRTRIWSTKCYNAITKDDISDAKASDLARSFHERVNDISTLGNVASFQNRYVKSYFTGNGQPSRISALDPDDRPPRVVVISPPTSIMFGQHADITARLLDERDDSCLSATLCWRKTGDSGWTSVKMERRCKAIFGARIPADRITSAGLEYYVAASDGSNSGYFPVTAPELPASLVVETQTDSIAPAVPGGLGVEGKTLKWPVVETDCHTYRIYRSTTPDFNPNSANYLCFVAAGQTAFLDCEFDYSDKPKCGTYYYRVTAMDKAGNESVATRSVNITYPERDTELFSGFVANPGFEYDRIDRRTRFGGHGGILNDDSISGWIFKKLHPHSMAGLNTLSGGPFMNGGATNVPATPPDSGLDSEPASRQAVYIANTGTLSQEIKGLTPGEYTFSMDVNAATNRSPAVTVTLGSHKLFTDVPVRTTQDYLTLATNVTVTGECLTNGILELCITQSKGFQAVVLDNVSLKRKGSQVE